MSTQVPTHHIPIVEKVDKKSKRKDAGEATKNPLGKRIKSTAVDESPADSVASTFGSIAASNYIEVDMKL